jgi:hypothetical protein
MEPTRSQLSDATDLMPEFRRPGISARLARSGHLLVPAPASRALACPHAHQAASVAWVANLLINAESVISKWYFSPHFHVRFPC